MNKIPTLFVRDPANMALVTREVTPGCEWVLAGEGLATRKRDGANVAIEVEVVATSGKHVVVAYWKRRNVTREERAAGKEPGYVPVEACDPQDKWLCAAANGTFPGLYGNPPSNVYTDWPAGLHHCEALGAKIQGGVEGPEYRLYDFDRHPTLLFPERGAGPAWPDAGCMWADLKMYLGMTEIEGIVFHHPDGRRAKIKRRDFGISWPVEK